MLFVLGGNFNVHAQRMCGDRSRWLGGAWRGLLSMCGWLTVARLTAYLL